MTTETVRLDALVRRLRQQGLKIGDAGNEETAATMLDAAYSLERLGDAMTKIGTWDCQGDSLRLAYDNVFGKSAWDALLLLVPND